MELGGALRNTEFFPKTWCPYPPSPNGVDSEHILKEQRDAQNVVSRFPFRGPPFLRKGAPALRHAAIVTQVPIP